MKSVVWNRPLTTELRGKKEIIPSWIWNGLPYRLTDALHRMLPPEGCEEIRIHSTQSCFLTLCGGENRSLNLTLSADEMAQAVSLFCGGSLYAHSETIQNGYISLPDGLRVGVCGRASVEQGHVIGVRDITGLILRLPCVMTVDASVVCALLRSFRLSKGVLVYAPPGEGKTTLLRSAAAMMAGGRNPVRVVVVDSRGEMEKGLRGRDLCMDVLSGYPKAVGIEIALRVMNAQLIVCDEMGAEAEARAVCDAAGGGAALLASAHACDFAGLCQRKNIRCLMDAGVFGAYVGLTRQNGQFRYRITDGEGKEMALC